MTGTFPPLAESGVKAAPAYIWDHMPCCSNVEMYGDLNPSQHDPPRCDARLHTPELLRSFTRRTELMTSLPISSNTSTFHTAPSAEVFVASWVASSCASMSVMGAFRFSMRLMLAA